MVVLDRKENLSKMQNKHSRKSLLPDLKVKNRKRD